MSEKTSNRVRLVCKIFLALLSVVVGVLCIAQILSIYHSAEQNPYTVESVSAAWGKIEVFFWFWIGCIFACAILFAILPERIEKPKAYFTTQELLRKLEKRFPVVTETQKKYRIMRHVLYALSLLLCIISASVSLSILLKKDYVPTFKGEFFAAHGGAADRLLCIMPWVLAAFLAAVTVALIADYLRKKEIALLKEELKKNPPKKVEKQKKTTFLKSEQWILAVRIGVFTIGAVFVVWGIVNGGMADVLAKAIEICTQCIGLG